MKPKLIPFLERHNIPYQIEGKNVKKGNLTISCPFCGDDPGFHLGVNLDDGAYSCWRDNHHRGRNTVKLVMKLIHCSVEEAKHELGLDILDFDSQKESLVDKIKNLFDLPKVTVIGKGGVDFLDFPEESRYITAAEIMARFYNYISSRGFRFDVIELVNKYDIRAAVYGDFKDRILIPVYMDGKLVTWTSRSIYSKTIPKYKDLAIEKSVRHCKYCLGNYDLISCGGRLLFVTEGPLDMLKMDFYSPEDVHATCLFTRFITTEQKLLLEQVSKKYECVYILLDNDAKTISWKMMEELSFIKNIKVGWVPSHVKDPGDMSEDEVQNFVKKL